MSAISTDSADYDNLLAGAKKAVRYGYKVYILPNPKGVRSADYIFERKGVYNMFDLKTITGTWSIGTRLEESIGQTNRVFINLATTYPTNRMATEIKQYFEANNEALEVLVAVGKKMVSAERNFVMKRTFFKEFRKAAEQLKKPSEDGFWGVTIRFITPTHTQRVVTKDVAKLQLLF